MTTMSPLRPVPAVAPDTASPDILIDRRSEAQRIVNAIFGATGRLLVLHGDHGTGKTELIKRWVIPALCDTPGQQGACEIAYGDCTRGFPEQLAGVQGTVGFDDVVQRRSIIIIDNFESILGLRRDERRTELDHMFARLHAPGCQATTVLVTDTRQLTSVYALTSYDPTLGSAVVEIAAVGIVEGLTELSQGDPDTAVAYAPEVLKKLAEEADRLEQRGWNVTFSLIKLVDRHWRDLRRRGGKRVIAEAGYDGLLPILRAHLDEQLEKLDAGPPGARAIAEAMLERLINSRAEAGDGAFADIPARFDISPNDVDTILARMSGADGLLHATSEGQYQLVPPQLAAVLEERTASRRVQLEQAHHTVNEGLRSSHELGTLLPRQLFDEIHGVRQHLILQQEELLFLLHCALRYDDGTSQGASRYWLGRVSDPVHARDLLFAGLADDAPEVRARSAALLQAFPEQEVRDRLHRLALEDSASTVRVAALSSLEAMQNQEPMQDRDLMQSLIDEVEDRKSPHRAEAIDALRIFKCAEIPPVLQAVVNRPEELRLREAAIRTLSLLDMPESVDSLLDIALKDRDVEDQRAATVALGSVRSLSLNRRILEHLQLPGLAPAWYIGGAMVGLLALVGAALVSAAIVDGSLPPAILLVAATLVIPTGILLQRMAAQRLKSTSPLGLLGLGLLALCAVSIMYWVHGLAHMSMGRWRRGLLLLGAELLGAVCLVFSVFLLALPLTLWLAPFYMVTGIVLFFGSYLVDVVGTFFDTALAPVRAVEKHTGAICQQIITNPVVTDLLFADLKSEQLPVSQRARVILRRFGHAAPPEHLVELLMRADPAILPLLVRSLARGKTDHTVATLEDHWPAAQPPARPGIAEVLYRRPSQRSLQVLDRLRGNMSRGLRLRSAWSAWQFRFSVWPWFARLAVYLAVPALCVLLYHGWKVITNPAWSTILVLKTPEWPPIGSVTLEKKIKTVAYLADVHPRDSRSALLDQFREGHADLSDPLSAAIAQGLLTIYHNTWYADTSGSRELRDALRVSVGAFAQALSDEDSITFRQSLQVLGSMGAGEDSALADAAVRELATFVSTQAAPLTRRGEATLDALARLPYARALPTLDRLATMPANAHLADAIRERMNQVVDTVSLRAIADSSQDRAGLLSVLRAVTLSPPPPSVGRSIRELEQQISRSCDRNVDGRCDSRDAALEAVEREPGSEQGYRSLLGQYLIGRQYLEARTEFRRLKARYPTSIWPRKVLAELDHEYLALEDTTAFHTSYNEMVDLRRLTAYEEFQSDTNTYIRIEADFAEVALTARRYAVMNSIAEPLLKPAVPHVYRLNMTLFGYIAKVVQRDRSGAEATLTRLQSVVDSLPDDFYNGWMYPGTEAFIKHSELPEQLRRSLLALCRQGYWYSREAADSLIAANRAALRLLPAS